MVAHLNTPGAGLMLFALLSKVNKDEMRSSIQVLACLVPSSSSSPTLVQELELAQVLGPLACNGNWRLCEDLWMS